VPIRVGLPYGIEEKEEIFVCDKTGAAWEVWGTPLHPTPGRSG